MFLRSTLLFLLLLCAICARASAGYDRAPIDTVYALRPGTGQSSGQSAVYFPANILGLPDTVGRYDVPAVRPEHICSLGMGGEIVVGFRDAVLRDGEGPDFTIFENAFFTPLGGGRIYAEPGRVAVSRDGVVFVDFPFDSLSLVGCAGRTPTIGTANPYNPAVSGGDAFDLADIGMDSVRYIRITDISAMVRNNQQHPNWDPTITGFDLDAVLGLHIERSLPATAGEPLVVAVDARLDIVLPERASGGSAELYSIDGRLVQPSVAWSGRRGVVALPRLLTGAYIAVVSFDGRRAAQLLFYDF